jgi:hypothetical protein
MENKKLKLEKNYTLVLVANAVYILVFLSNEIILLITCNYLIGLYL